MNNPFNSMTRWRETGGLLSLLVASALLVSCTTDSRDPTEGEGLGLSGRVVATNNAPIAGVVVTLSHNGSKDTTDNEGRYEIRPAAGQMGTSIQDTVVFSKNGQSLARVSVSSWIETLPDVQVVQRDISGLLQGSTSSIARIEGVVTGDGIDSTAPVTSEFFYNPLTGNYSGFVYFPVASSVQYYQVQVKIYGPGDILVGNSLIVPFSSYAGNITIPTFSTGNARPIANAGVDTAVVTGSTIYLKGTGVDSGGTITSLEWSIGGSPFVVVSGGDTSFSRATQGAYVCILRATDNHGNQALDTMTVAVLTHGVTWTTRTSGTTATLNSVVWTGSKFVAVGSSGAVVTSSDGITWSASTVSGSPPFSSVAWSGNKLVAVTISSGGGSKLVPFLSTNGSTWTADSSLTVRFPISGILKISAVDTTLVVSSMGPSNRFLARSTNGGTTWRTDSLPPATTLSLASAWAFTWHNGRFVGVGTNGISVSSVNGIDWTRHTDQTTWPRPAGGTYDYTMMAVTSTGSYAVAVGYAGHVMRSNNGTTWQAPRIAGNIPPQEGGSTTGDLQDVVYTGTGLVAVGNGYQLVSADHGETWARVQTGATNLRSVAWNGTRLVAVGGGGSIATSP